MTMQIPSHMLPPGLAARAGQGGGAAPGGDFGAQLRQMSGGRVPDGRALDSQTLARLGRMMQQSMGHASLGMMGGGGGQGGGVAGLMQRLLSQGEGAGAGAGSVSPAGGEAAPMPPRTPEAGPDGYARPRDPATGEPLGGASGAGPSQAQSQARSSPPAATADESPETVQGAASAGTGPASADGAAPTPDRAATDWSQVPYGDLIQEAGERFGVDPELIRAVVDAESDFNPQARSHAGAQGLMQLMPATAEELGVSEPFDPQQNVMGGTRYLKQLLGRYDGDRDLALAAYNWGMGNLERSPERMPDETIAYVRRIREDLGVGSA